MPNSTSLWLWWLRQFTYLLIATLGCIVALGVVLTHASEEVDWARPPAQALKRVGDLPSTQQTPVLFYNIDCQTITYRLVSTSIMREGCFTPTAFGWFDSDQAVAIFHGSDEGVPILDALPHQVVAPWPRAVNFVSLSAVPTGGSRVSMYKNPLGVMQDQRNLLLQLTGKQLTQPPELTLNDEQGRALVINAQTLAFSDNGSWLVAETLYGRFVRINLASLDVTAFAPAYGAQGHAGLLASHLAISDDGRFVATANDAASALKVYDLTQCVDATCISHDYRGLVDGAVPGLRNIKRVRFVQSGLLSLDVTGATPQNSGVYLLAPTHQINSLLAYLALGDSFTSGEGAFDYLQGTDTTTNRCHLSLHSYPLQITQALFTQQSGRSVACSGARIYDLASTASGYRGQVRGGQTMANLQQTREVNRILADFEPGNIAQQYFARHYQPNVLTVSIGGNDIGFGDIIERCAVPRISLHRSDGDCFNTYEDRVEVLNLVDRTVTKWTGLFKQLRSAVPATTIYAVGYPSIVDGRGHCPVNVQLSKSEIEFAETLTAYLNKQIARSAQQADVTFVDIEDALFGHRLCEARGSQVAVNGITAGTDIGVLGVRSLGRESYHPNALGQRLMAEAIMRKTNRLSSSAKHPVNPADRNAVLTTPQSGRSITSIVSAEFTGRWLTPSSTAGIQLDGLAAGLKPNTSYSVTLSSSTTLGAVSTDANGNLTGSVTVPSNSASGGQTIQIGGEGQGGPITIIQPVYIPHQPHDADGDSIPDATDGCPTAVNSGQDVDADGTDDICDPTVGEPVEAAPSTPAQSSTTIHGQVTSKHSEQRPAARLSSSARSAAQTGQVAGKTFARAAPAQNQPNATPKGTQCQQHFRFLWWPWLLLACLLWLLLGCMFYKKQQRS